MVLKEAVKYREQSSEARQRWLETVEQFHSAIDHAYPEDFWELWKKLPSGDPTAVENAVLFLEADPWFFRSGYVKSGLIKKLNRLPLLAELEARLRNVLLDVVKTRDRREFRSYCHLARRVESADLRRDLSKLQTSADPNVQRRVKWMLSAMDPPSATSKPRKSK